MNTMERRNAFNVASLILSAVGVVGFIAVAEVIPGRADGISLSGVLMLSADVLWFAVLAATASAVAALVRKEKSRKMSFTALVFGGVPAVVITLAVLAIVMKR